MLKKQSKTIKKYLIKEKLMKNQIKTISKRIVAFLLVSMLIFGTMPGLVFASGSGITETGADTPTNIPDHSGLDEGEVWTDKSVFDKNDGTFDIKLTAMGKRFEFDPETTITKKPANVVFVLDTSTSMTYEDLKDMMIAVRDAGKAVLRANPVNPANPDGPSNNRVAVVYFDYYARLARDTTSYTVVNNVATTKTAYGYYTGAGATTGTWYGTNWVNITWTWANTAGQLDDLVQTHDGYQYVPRTHSRTNTMSGLNLANELLRGNSIYSPNVNTGFAPIANADPIIILMSDGAPNGYYGVAGSTAATTATWTGTAPTGGAQAQGDNPSVQATIERAAEIANSTIGTGNNQVKIYTVGYLNNIQAVNNGETKETVQNRARLTLNPNNKLNGGSAGVITVSNGGRNFSSQSGGTAITINNVGAAGKSEDYYKYNTDYFNPLTGAALTSTFQTIVDSIRLNPGNPLAPNTNLTITDVIGAGFVIDPGALNADNTLKNVPIGNAVYDPATRTVTWTIAAHEFLYDAVTNTDLLSAAYSFTFQVNAIGDIGERADSDGKHFTNAGAKTEFTPHANNRKYPDKTRKNIPLTNNGWVRYGSLAIDKKVYMDAFEGEVSSYDFDSAKWVSRTQVVQGETVIYKITLTNPKYGTVNNVNLTDELTKRGDAGFSTTGTWYDAAGALVTNLTTSVTTGTPKIFYYVVTLNAPGDYRNIASANGIDSPPADVRVIEKITFTFNKVWDDDGWLAGRANGITVTLSGTNATGAFTVGGPGNINLAGGTIGVYPYTVAVNGNTWTVTITNLPPNTVYSVTETAPPQFYEIYGSATAGNNGTITNKLIKGPFQFTKMWDDDDWAAGRANGINVAIKSGETTIMSGNINGTGGTIGGYPYTVAVNGNTWTVTINDIPQYYSNLSVTETQLTGYNPPAIVGTEITNAKTPAPVNVEITKLIEIDAKYLVASPTDLDPVLICTEDHDHSAVCYNYVEGVDYGVIIPTFEFEVVKLGENDTETLIGTVTIGAGEFGQPKTINIPVSFYEVDGATIVIREIRASGWTPKDNIDEYTISINKFGRVLTDGFSNPIEVTFTNIYDAPPQKPEPLNIVINKLTYNTRWSSVIPMNVPGANFGFDVYIAGVLYQTVYISSFTAGFGSVTVALPEGVSRDLVTVKEKAPMMSVGFDWTWSADPFNVLGNRVFSFRNFYNETHTPKISITKLIRGENAPAETFTFELYEVGLFRDRLIGTYTRTGAETEIAVIDLTDYTNRSAVLRLVEVGDKIDWTRDTTVHTITIVQGVIQGANGNLYAAQFTNVYEAAPTIAITKEVDIQAGTPEEITFKFDLYDVTGIDGYDLDELQPVKTYEIDYPSEESLFVTVRLDGKDGNPDYTNKNAKLVLKEQIPEEEDYWDYDPAVYDITVTAGRIDGVADRVYYAEFENTYYEVAPEIIINKAVTITNLNPASIPDFSFELFELIDDVLELIGTYTIDMDGKLTGTTGLILLDGKDDNPDYTNKTTTLVLKEVQNAPSYWNYDKIVYTINIVNGVIVGEEDKDPVFEFSFRNVYTRNPDRPTETETTTATTETTTTTEVITTTEIITTTGLQTTVEEEEIEDPTVPLGVVTFDDPDEPEEQPQTEPQTEPAIEPEEEIEEMISPLSVVIFDEDEEEPDEELDDPIIPLVVIEFIEIEEAIEEPVVEEPVEEPTVEAPKANPKTSDMGMFGLLIALIPAAAGVVIRRKRNPN